MSSPCPVSIGSAPSFRHCWPVSRGYDRAETVKVLSFPEPPPAFFLDLLVPGLEGQLADALGELVFVHFFLLFH